MIELTSENAPEYLRSRGRVSAGPIRIETLGWGVSNLVLRVITPQQSFVLKQSRPQLRTRDPWYSDLDRVYREQEVMEMLRPLLPELTVPAVLFVDRENYVFAMSHAPAGSRVWKETLLAGKTEAAVARRAGSNLGTIHAATAKDTSLVERFHDHTVFVQLRVDPFYYRVQERRPEVAGAVAPIVDRMLSLKEALCHGDYSPKNILTHERGFTLVDYETAHFGDPSMDLGFFLSHLVLKAAKHADRRHDYFELTRVFWDEYMAMIGDPSAEQGHTAGVNPAVRQAQGIEHFGVCILARIDGTSPVDYLPEEPKREAIRNIGRTVVWERPRTWEKVLTICETHLSKF
jgi:aminoglycoside phosphotransferase (APT) family kinase protein